MSDSFFQFFTRQRPSYQKDFYSLSHGKKIYSRFDYKKLPQPEGCRATFSAVVAARKTSRDFSSDPLSLQKLSNILFDSLANKSEAKGGEHNYPFPSGGSMYPLEGYLHLINVADIEAGVYHYSPDMHGIARISEHAVSLDEVNQVHHMGLSNLPAVLLHITMKKSDNFRRYGSFAYALSMLEAGHIGQNICLSSAAWNVGACPFGGAEYDVLHKILGVDGYHEHFVYAIAFGDVTCLGNNV